MTRSGGSTNRPDTLAQNQLTIAESLLRRTASVAHPPSAEQSTRRMERALLIAHELIAAVLAASVDKNRVGLPAGPARLRTIDVQYCKACYKSRWDMT
jgi:hypothetical protein